MIKLVDIYTYLDSDKILYELLKERTANMNISHRELPSFRRHQKFIFSFPYKEWLFLEVGKVVVGSVYVTKHDEVGLFIFKKYQGKGYGSRAIQLIKRRYPKTELLANINPENKRSQEFFEKQGFKLIQYTYRLGRG